MSDDLSRELAHAFAGSFTELVECEGESARGFVDRETRVESDGMGGQQAIGRASVVLAAGDLLLAVAGKTVAIGGKEYQVRERLPEDDGAIHRLILA